jgi:hypothetical protein
LAIFAQAEGKSINSIAQEALFKRLAAWISFQFTANNIAP